MPLALYVCCMLCMNLSDARKKSELTMAGHVWYGSMEIKKYRDDDVDDDDDDDDYTKTIEHTKSVPVTTCVESNEKKNSNRQIIASTCAKHTRYTYGNRQRQQITRSTNNICRDSLFLSHLALIIY